MTVQDSAISGETVALAGERHLVPGTGWAALGVLLFSFTFPATHLALGGMSPALVGGGRSVVGAAGGLIFLVARRASLPRRANWPGLFVVAMTVGVGFGLLSAIALPAVGVAPSGVIFGLVPLGTAVVGTLRGGERPSGRFWVASLTGTLLVVGYALSQGGGELRVADLLLLVGLVFASVGYAEGGRLSQQMPAWQVICWALLFALPVSLPISLVAAVHTPPHASAPVLAGFAYVSLVSVLLGFFAWNRGLAAAGIARASQLQLAQPLLTLAWAALLLHEEEGTGTLAVALAVLGCVAITQRSRIGGGPAGE
jgi:drug/metabolite transporter (DMT)-like permease